MQAKEAAHNYLWQTSDAIFGAIVLVSIALEMVYPLAIGIRGLPRICLGAQGVIFGAAWIAASKRALARAGQPSAPGVPTSRLVKTGVFNSSRNPLYLGLLLVQAGLGIAIGWAWLVVMVLPATTIVYFILIRPEERYLEATFGEEYRHYKQSTRRWL